MRKISQDATTTRKAAHIPPPPKMEPELVLLPNMLLPVVVLLVFDAPKMPVPVFVFEPKPEANGKLDTVCRETRGARQGAHQGSRAERGPRK